MHTLTLSLSLSLPLLFSRHSANTMSSPGRFRQTGSSCCSYRTRGRCLIIRTPANTKWWRWPQSKEGSRVETRALKIKYRRFVRRKVTPLEEIERAFKSDAVAEPWNFQHAEWGPRDDALVRDESFITNYAIIFRAVRARLANEVTITPRRRGAR